MLRPRVASGRPSSAGQELLGRVGSGGTSSGFERPDEARRDQHHQLGLFGAIGLALEQEPMIGSLLRIGIAGVSSCEMLSSRPGDGERLPVAQLDVGFGAPRRERRDAEALRA